MKEILDIEVNPKFRGANSYGIQTTNKKITRFFLEKGFKPGKKVYTFRIPDYIKSADREIKVSFFRGIFDTDGCLVEKNRTNIRYYPRIEVTTASHKLAEDLIDLLNSIGLKAHKWTDRGVGRIGLSGFENLKRLIYEIKPSNPKHFKRYQDSIYLGRS